MNVCVVTTHLEPWAEYECPMFVFAYNPDRETIRKLLSEWEPVIKNGGIDAWHDDDWDYHASYIKVIES